MRSLDARRFAAMTASTVLHMTVLGAFMRSDESHTALENAAQNASRKQLIASLFFMQDPAAVHTDGYSFVPTVQTPQTITLPIPPLPQIEPVAADSFEKGAQIETADDLAEVERLQGIYVKQIADRITRLMQMATAQAGAEASDRRCIVHVIQNESGDVLEVDMDECEREPIARERVASAIRAASPLPAPPDGLAMGSYLTIDASTL